MVIVDGKERKGVDKFLGKYTAKSTINSYRSNLRKFFAHVYPELGKLYPTEGTRKQKAEQFSIFDKKMDELSLIYVNESERDFEGDMTSFRIEVMGDNAPKTIASGTAAIFKFLGVNNLEFSKDYKKDFYKKGNKKGLSEELVPNRGQLKKIIYQLPPQGRALVMVLATTGMRVNEALQLRKEDIDLEYEAVFPDQDGSEKRIKIPKISIRAETAKNGEARITFLTQEAKAEMERWYEARPQYLQDYRDKARRDPDESLVFPFGYQAFKGMWRVVLRKVGLFEVDERTNRVKLRIHNIRKFFRTWGGWANPDVAEALMGHQEGLTAIYSRQDQALGQLVEGFKGAEKNLTLDRGQIFEAPSEELQDLKSWNRQLLAETDAAREERKELRKDIADLKEMVEGLNSYVDMLKENTAINPEKIYEPV